MTTATIHRHSEVVVTLDDDTEVSVTNYGDVDTHGVLADRRPDGKIVVSYLAQDCDGGGWNPMEDDEGVEFILFDNGRERDQWIDNNLSKGCASCDELEADHSDDFCGGPFEPNTSEWPALFASKHAHWVERYEHSGVIYALTYESSQVDRRWDVAPGVAVLRLDDDWCGDLTDIARNKLAEYTSWCNGDVWGVCHFIVDPATGEEVEIDAVWGYIGSEYAESELASGHKLYLEAT